MVSRSEHVGRASGPIAVGDLFGHALAAHGVRHLFTLVGSHINPLLAGCADAGIALVDTRHEATAGHAAEGFAKATGATGACVVTAGPGFTNALTPLASAYVDAVPMLLVAGAPPTDRPLNPLQGGFDQVAMARPITKWATRAGSAAEIPGLVAEAFARARSGRPGPVFLEIPVDIAHGNVMGTAASVVPARHGEAAPAPNNAHLDEVLARIARARQPLLLAGGGIKYADADGELLRFAHLTGVPVLTNLNSHGLVPASDPAWGGIFSMLPSPGIHGHADLLLVIGARFGMLTGGFPGRHAAPGAGVVQVDIDGSELDHLRPGDLGIEGDCQAVLTALNQRLERRKLQPADHLAAWRDRVGTARDDQLASWSRCARAWHVPHPFTVAETVVATLPRDTTFVTDGGEAKAWLEMNLRLEQGGRYLSRGYSGCLGSGQGLALGAHAADPARPVCLFIGDGAWGFHLQESDTFLRHGAPIITVVLNNGCWGSIRHGQQVLWHGERDLVTELGQIRYDRVAAGFGGHVERVERLGDLAPALHRSIASGVPSVIDVTVDPAPNPAQPPAGG